MNAKIKLDCQYALRLDKALLDSLRLAASSEGLPLPVYMRRVLRGRIGRPAAERESRLDALREVVRRELPALVSEELRLWLAGGGVSDLVRELLKGSGR